METPLLDYGGSVNKKVEYKIKEDGSGIELKSFELGGLKLKVEQVIQYRPWNWGKIIPGAGQVGIYKLRLPDGGEKFALIKDYKAAEGDWRIFLIYLTNTERELKDKLWVDGNYGALFIDYLDPEVFDDY